MEKSKFYELLVKYDPKKINEWIIKKSKKPKQINGVTFLDDDYLKEEKENNNEK